MTECVVCLSGLEAAPGVVARWPFCHHDVCAGCVRRLDACPVCRGPGRAGMADLFPDVDPVFVLSGLPDQVGLAGSTQAGAADRLVMLESLVREAARAPDAVVAGVAIPASWVRRALSALFLDMPVLLCRVPHALLGPAGARLAGVPKSLVLPHALLAERGTNTGTVVGAFARQIFRVWRAHAATVERGTQLERVLVGRLANLPDWALVEICGEWDASGIGAAHPRSLALWRSVLAGGIARCPSRALCWLGAVSGTQFEAADWSTTCRHSAAIAALLHGTAVGTPVDACAGMPCERCDATTFVGLLLLLERTEFEEAGVLAALLSVRAQKRAALAAGKQRAALFRAVAGRALERAIAACSRSTLRNALLIAGAVQPWHPVDTRRALVRGVASRITAAACPPGGADPQPPGLALQLWTLAAGLDTATADVPPCVWGLRVRRQRAGGGDSDGASAYAAELLPNLEELVCRASPTTGTAAIMGVPSACLLAYHAATAGAGCGGTGHRHAVLAVLVMRGAVASPVGRHLRAVTRAAPRHAVAAWPAPLVGARTPLTTALQVLGRRPSATSLFATALFRPAVPVNRNAWLRYLLRASEASVRQTWSPIADVLWCAPTRVYAGHDAGARLLTVAAGRLHRFPPALATTVFVHALCAEYAPVRSEDVQHRLPVHTRRSPCRGPFRWSPLLCARSGRLRAALLRAAACPTTAVCEVWKRVALALFCGTWTPDPAVACTCPGPMLCDIRTGSAAWEAVLRAVRTGEPPTVDDVAQDRPVRTVLAGLRAWGLLLDQRTEPFTCTETAAGRHPTELAAELWLETRRLPTDRFFAWAAGWLPLVVERVPDPAVRALVRAYARPREPEADGAAALALGVALLACQAPGGAHRAPKAARERFFAALDADLQREGQTGAFPLAAPPDILVHDARVCHAPPAVRARLAVALGRRLVPARAAGLVQVCRARETRRIVAPLLPAMLWRAACPRLHTRSTEDLTGAVFRRAQAALGNGLREDGSVVSGPSVAWLAVADLPHALLTAQIMFPRDDAPLCARLGANLLTNCSPPPPLESAGDWVVRLAAGGLSFVRWPHGGGAVFALARRERRVPASLVRRSVRRWLRTPGGTAVQALAVALLLLAAGPRVRPRLRRQALSRAAGVVTASGSALCASIVMSATARTRSELGPAHCPSPGRLAGLWRAVATDSLDFVERLDSGLGWFEAAAVMRTEPAPRCAVSFEPVSVFLHAVAAFGPPCLVAGCGMVAADHPAQAFSTTMRWLASVHHKGHVRTAPATTSAGPSTSTP